jgi:hypothetical protein
LAIKLCQCCPIHGKGEETVKPVLISSQILLTVLLLSIVCPRVLSQGRSKTPKAEITPRRPECAILLPERGERNDLAKLIRADQFLQCERDGFPTNLAPPWTKPGEGEQKLGDACEYFASQSARQFPQVGQASLKLAADRCRINVAQAVLDTMVAGPAQK